MQAGKPNAFCVLRVLEEYSDERHILTQKDVLDKVRLLFGVTIDRRALYNAISALESFGYDISNFNENGKGYYLRSRLFEESEARLLLDAVWRSPAIPRKHTSDLAEKIQSGFSIHQRRQTVNIMATQARSKTPNTTVFYSIDVISEAIAGKRKMLFHYLRYDFEKKLKPRRAVPYVVSPYGLAYANERYYLVCAYENYPVSHYRVDRMRNAAVLEERAKPAPRRFNLQEYTDQSVYLYGGELETIVLDCDENILDDVLDRFGLGVEIKPSGDGRFRARMNMSSRGMLFWALQYLQYCEVIEPYSLRQRITETIENSPYTNKDSESTAKI